MAFSKEGPRHYIIWLHLIRRQIIYTNTTAETHHGLCTSKTSRTFRPPLQSGMMHLANLIRFPCIHREIVTLNQNCQPCITIGKNLKPLFPKKTSQLPPLQEPNEEVQWTLQAPSPTKTKWTHISISR